MDYSTPIPAWLIGLLAAWFIASLCLYGVLLRKLFMRGGRIATVALGPLDAGFVCFFITWFSWLSYAGFAGRTRAVTDSDLLAGALHLTLIVLLITGFLQFRRINVLEQFGIGWIGALKAALLAVPLMVAAFPILNFAGVVMLKILGDGAKSQALVQFFNDASNKGKIGPVISTMALGVFLAPAAEEFIFRGYLYTTAKKYAGLIPAMILTSTLFAVIHLNLASLPSLFVLAVCFTVAYEITGSILVPMAMHALFNLSEFCVMLAYPHLQQ